LLLGLCEEPPILLGWKPLAGDSHDREGLILISFFSLFATVLSESSSPPESSSDSIPVALSLGREKDGWLGLYIVDLGVLVVSAVCRL
jgi:hypothetical protein